MRPYDSGANVSARDVIPDTNTIDERHRVGERPDQKGGQSPTSFPQQRRGAMFDREGLVTGTRG
jgi:hypothetical protein